MATKFMCSNPEHPEKKHSKYYDKMTLDGFCPDCDYGEGVLMEIEAGKAPPLPHPIGLCIMVCDASWSMQNEPAFPNSPDKKIDLVARAAASGIADLYPIGKPTDAYIILIAFAGEAVVISDETGSKPFLKNMRDIQRSFPTAEDLKNFLVRSLSPGVNVSANATNITRALDLAHRIDQGAHRGNLEQWGLPNPFKLLYQPVGRKDGGNMVDFPNVRTLIYSDGAHYPGDGTALRNPYENDERSTLMTVFFGAEDQAGAREMQSLACSCPMHERPGFFLINNAQRYQTLRYLFRMASGTSGFCPECLQGQRISSESIESELP
jgi:hypothetical protein